MVTRRMDTVRNYTTSRAAFSRAPQHLVYMAFIEWFNRTYREEILNAYLFASTQEAQQCPMSSCAKTRPSRHRRKNCASRNQTQTLARERVTRRPQHLTAEAPIGGVVGSTGRSSHRSMTGLNRAIKAGSTSCGAVPSIYSSASPWVGSQPAARNTLDSARIPRASKLLICGLFQKGRVLAQDGIDFLRSTAEFWHRTGKTSSSVTRRSPGMCPEVCRKRKWRNLPAVHPRACGGNSIYGIRTWWCTPSCAKTRPF